MKHRVIKKTLIKHLNWSIIVQLIPESEQETEAIRRVAAMEADEEQTDLINNYLNFRLGGLTIHRVKEVYETKVVLEASIL